MRRGCIAIFTGERNGEVQSVQVPAGSAVEATKVTWPTRRETAITTAMVFVMVAVASIFFLVADQVMRIVVTLVLGIGG